MRKSILFGLVVVLSLGVRAAAEDLSLPATKDTKVSCFKSDESDETGWNNGKAERLRAKGIQKNSAEIILIDFDRAALKAFIEKNAGKDVKAKLALKVVQVQAGPAKLELAALDTASEWTEGDKDSANADKGESSCAAAQKGVKKWTTADGKEADGLRDLVYNREDDKVKTLQNANSVEVSEKSTTVELELDAAFLKHLATDANCRGVVLFHRDQRAKLDFSSREKADKAPTLVVTAK